MQRILLVVAVALGVSLGYVDSRPTWDDTGLVAALLVLVTATFGAAAPRRPWLWAILVGAWVPLFDIVLRSNYGSLMALGFAFGGAYAGAWLRRAISPAQLPQ